mgnify:CR=1 FL=1
MCHDRRSRKVREETYSLSSHLPSFEHVTPSHVHGWWICVHGTVEACRMPGQWRARESKTWSSVGCRSLLISLTTLRVPIAPTTTSTRRTATKRRFLRALLVWVLLSEEGGWKRPNSNIQTKRSNKKRQAKFTELRLAFNWILERDCPAAQVLHPVYKRER